MTPNTRTLARRPLFLLPDALMQVAKLGVKERLRLLKVTPDLQAQLERLKGDFLLAQHAETNGGSLKWPI